MATRRQPRPHRSNNSVELYNIAADVGERNNRALKDTARRDELLADLLRCMERIKAPLRVEPNPGCSPG